MTISIIVPVYNAEPYLHACLDSVISQSFRDFELLLIDDGSTDASCAICDEYTEKDERIKVWHKENGGVSSARNAGLGMALGEWVLFVDADDTLAEDGLQTLANCISDRVGMVMGEYSLLQDSGVVDNPVLTGETGIMTCSRMMMQLMKPSGNHYQGYLWNKLFRLACIRRNDVRFNEGLYFGEDRLFVAQYLCTVRGDVFYTNQPVYNYYQRKESAMESLRSGYNPKFATDVEACVLAKDCVFRYTRNPKLRYAALWIVCESAIRNMYLMQRCGVDNTELLCGIIEKVKQSGAYPLFVVKYATKRILHPGYFRTK